MNIEGHQQDFLNCTILKNSRSISLSSNISWKSTLSFFSWFTFTLFFSAGSSSLYSFQLVHLHFILFSWFTFTLFFSAGSSNADCFKLWTRCHLAVQQNRFAHFCVILNKSLLFYAQLTFSAGCNWYAFGAVFFGCLSMV